MLRKPPRTPLLLPLKGEVRPKAGEGGQGQDAKETPPRTSVRPSPFKGGRRASLRRAARARPREPRTHHLLREVRLPGLRLHHPRDRAAPVLVQQPLWRLPGLRWARHRARGRPALVVPDDTLSLRDSAIPPWSKTSSPYYQQTLEALARAYKFSTATPGRSCRRRPATSSSTAPARTQVTFNYNDGLRAYRTTKTFEGVIPNLERR